MFHNESCVKIAVKNRYRKRTLFIAHSNELVTQAARAFGAEKMNDELLGMGDAHLHWHLTPRVSGDLGDYGNHGREPVWWYPMEKMYSDENRPTSDEPEKLKQPLSSALVEML